MTPFVGSVVSSHMRSSPGRVLRRATSAAFAVPWGRQCLRDVLASVVSEATMEDDLSRQKRPPSLPCKD